MNQESVPIAHADRSRPSVFGWREIIKGMIDWLFGVFEAFGFGEGELLFGD